MSGTDAFTATIYDTIRDGAARSAAVVAPILFDEFTPETVVDVGCGEGHWAAAFAQMGCDVTGIDGPHVSHVLGDRFIPADLSLPLPSGGYDLAICLEVGEHLPASRSASLVAELCRLAPVVVFSAAIPHQTGPGHINCRWPSWWAEHFAANGYRVDGSLRWSIWDDTRIEPWYRQNLLVATTGTEHVGPLDVVHPEIHGWGR